MIRYDGQKKKFRPSIHLAKTPEDEETIKDFVCSQENQPRTHMNSRDIAKELDISHFSGCRMIKTKGVKQLKLPKTSYMNDSTRTRRVKRASVLGEKSEKNPRIIERGVFQDKSDFLLQFPINSESGRVYFKGKKKDNPGKTLSHQTNRKCVKVMVSAALTWHGVTKR